MIKLSIGVRTQAWFFTAGTAGRCGALKPQWSAFFSPDAESGHTAPWSIHARRMPTCSAVSASPFFGIFKSSLRPDTACTIRLSEPLPAMITAPLSLPLSASDRRSNRKPASARLSP